MTEYEWILEKIRELKEEIVSPKSDDQIREAFRKHRDGEISLRTLSQEVEEIMKVWDRKVEELFVFLVLAAARVEQLPCSNSA